MRRIEDRFDSGAAGDCRAGRVKWDAVKSLWWLSMTLGGIVGIVFFFSWVNLAVFLGLSALILCGGHSLGMHRKFIHDSFDCPKWLEYLGVYLGTLVGLGGPMTMMKTHDMRDWAQRQTRCHDYFGHGRSIGIDFIWQVHCRLVLDNGPRYVFPDGVKDDRVFRFLQRTSMAQQIPLALMLFAIGGWGCVLWGVALRVSVSITGHWLIGYFAHNHGPQDWLVDGAAVQGHNIPFCGLITFGECWHNNHHSYPESARLGLHKGQLDPGWWVLLALRRVGLVKNLTLPSDLPPRPALIPVKAS